MAGNQGRSAWRPILTNFLKSLRIRPPKGKVVGEDHMGNFYYESEKDPNSSRNSAVRWFVPKEKDDWQQSLPAEWEAWLRGRRKVPPTKEEIMKNAAIAEMKKMKGSELSAKAEEDRKKHGVGFAVDPVKAFPQYEEYEKQP